MRNLHNYLIALGMMVLAGCASFQPDTSLPVTVIASPNHDARHPTMIVVHYTSNDDIDHSIDTLTSSLRKVSAHYLVDRQGKLYQLVPEDRRAWHAGKSYWAGMTDINSASIGVELDNNGTEPFTVEQIDTLLNLLGDIKKRHRIKARNIVGHSDVAPGRKIDPGGYFPWRRLAASGFGVWCNSPEEVIDGPTDMLTILTVLGYDPSNPEASRQAFRSHYLTNEDGVISEDESRELKVAQCLQKQMVKPVLE